MARNAGTCFNAMGRQPTVMPRQASCMISVYSSAVCLARISQRGKATLPTQVDMFRRLVRFPLSVLSLVQTSVDSADTSERSFLPMQKFSEVFVELQTRFGQQRKTMSIMKLMQRACLRHADSCFDEQGKWEIRRCRDSEKVQVLETSRRARAVVAVFG